MGDDGWMGWKGREEKSREERKIDVDAFVGPLYRFSSTKDRTMTNGESEKLSDCSFPCLWQGRWSIARPTSRWFSAS